MKRAVQGVLVFRSWGGRRRGAGRPPARARRTVAHRRRAAPDPRTPVHVTLRAVAGIASLRGAHVFGAVRRALAAASRRTFRLVHYSVQSDHVHLLVEAEGGTSLARGCQGLSVRVAKAVNRVLGRRGAVWGDRYHARPLRTPREVRNALVYVLQNWFKHVPGSRGRDPLSSAAWFDGWQTPPALAPGPAPVRAPRTWLARVGWVRHGRLRVDEGPRGAPSPPRV
jgi:REP-associated tyrosine transposase